MRKKKSISPPKRILSENARSCSDAVYYIHMRNALVVLCREEDLFCRADLSSFREVSKKPVKNVKHVGKNAS